MYSQLGNIQFEGLFGPSGQKSAIDADLPVHALIDGKPRIQRTGTNLETIDLSLNFNISFCDPEEEYEKLKKFFEDGEILPFIAGNGKIYGNFVIKSIGKTIGQTLRDGTCIQMSVEISLIEYVIPNDSDKPAVTFAKTSDEPALSIPNIKPVSIPFETGAEALKASTVSKANAKNIKTLSVDNIFRPQVEKIMRQTDEVLNGVLKVKTAIDEDPTSKLYDVTRQLTTSCDAMNTLCSDILSDGQDLLDAIDANDSGGISTAISALVDRVDLMVQRDKDFVAASNGLNALLLTGG